MALLSDTASSKPRRPKAFAIRTFPPLCGPSRTNINASRRKIISDRNLTPSINPSPEPTSVGPGSDFLSHGRELIKSPSAFAARSFPQGCGSPADAIPKTRVSEEVSTAARGNMKEETKLEKPMSSDVPDLVRADRLCGTEGSDSDSKVEEMEEEKLNEVVRRITEGASSQGKNIKHAVVERFLGEKNGETLVKKSLSGKDGENRRKGLGEKDGEKPVRKSLTNFSKDGRRFSSPVRLEPKKELNNAMRRGSTEGGSGSGKIVKNSVVGRSLDGKDGKKTGGKRSFVPDLVEGSRSQKSQPVEVRYERLIVQALMAAKRCPWMQGKGKGSVGSRSRLKKLKS